MLKFRSLMLLRWIAWMFVGGHCKWYILQYHEEIMEAENSELEEVRRMATLLLAKMQPWIRTLSANFPAPDSDDYPAFVRIHIQHAHLVKGELDNYCRSNPILSADEALVIVDEINAELAKPQFLKNHTIDLGGFAVTGDVVVRLMEDRAKDLIIVGNGDGRCIDINSKLSDSVCPHFTRKFAYEVLINSVKYGIIRYRGYLPDDLRVREGDLEKLEKACGAGVGTLNNTRVSLSIGNFVFENARMTRVERALEHERKSIVNCIESARGEWDPETIAWQIENRIYPRRLTLMQGALLSALADSSASERIQLMEEAGIIRNYVLAFDDLGGCFQAIVASENYRFAGSFLRENIALNGYVYDAMGAIVARVVGGRVVE